MIALAGEFPNCPIAISKDGVHRFLLNTIISDQLPTLAWSKRGFLQPSTVKIFLKGTLANEGLHVMLAERSADVT